jgi:hypothetical protein
LGVLVTTFNDMPHKKNVALRFLAPPRLATEVVVGPGHYLVGSDGGCDITLANATIDPEHCIITWDGDDLSIEDLMSLNGVIVNHRRVTSARIRIHDTVRIGRETLLVYKPARPKLPESSSLGGVVLEIYGIESGNKNGAHTAIARPSRNRGAETKLLSSYPNLKFEGCLSDLCLPEILEGIGAGGKTGTLFVQTDDRDITIFFDAGKAVYATPSLERDKIGELLVARGAVDAAQLYEALKKQKKSKKRGKFFRLGTILVDMGALDRGVLVNLISEQIEKALLEVLSESDGTFVFEPRCQLEDEDVLADLDVAALLARRSPDIESLAEIKQNVPTAHEIFAVNADPSTSSDIKLALEEWKILSLVDGRRDVAAIAQVARSPIFTTLKILSRLVEADLIGRISPEAIAAFKRDAKYRPQMPRAHKGFIKRIVNRLRKG